MHNIEAQAVQSFQPISVSYEEQRESCRSRLLWPSGRGKRGLHVGCVPMIGQPVYPLTERICHNAFFRQSMFEVANFIFVEVTRDVSVSTILQRRRAY